MYPVSNDYLTAMMSHSTRRRIKGTIGNVAFTGSDILEGSFEISNRCAESSDMKIGGVYIGMLSMTFVPSFLTKVSRTQYQDKDVSISIGLYVNDTWVDVPCGIFTLQAPKISKQGVSVEGYDYMKKLDKTFGMSTTSGKIYDYLKLIEDDCGVVCGMTQQECEALPNGDENISMYAENDIETYRDMLYWIAQTCGRFATIDRQGQLVLRKFGVSNSVVLDEMHRDVDVVFSGYTTHYTGISVVDIETGYTNYYGLDPDDGLTMNLGSNPFLQYGLQEVKDAMRIAILNEIADIEYTPYEVVSARDPIFDLGDEIQFSGGLSGGCTGCVMSYVYTATGYEFAGYGDDPALANGRSKVDKNISGLLSKTDSNTVTYYFYENVTEIGVAEDTECTISNIRFAAKKETDVVVQCQFKIDTTSTAEDTRTIVYNDVEPDPPVEDAENETVEVGYFDKNETPIIAHVRYYYDDILVAYEPIDTWTEEGYHLFSGFYYLHNVSIDREHTWRVTLELANGEGEIDVKDSHLLISGQGLVSEMSWDGKINVTEYVGTYDVKCINVIAITEEDVDVSMSIPEGINVTDVVGTNDITVLEPEEVDDSLVSIVLRNIVYNLVTEDGLNNLTDSVGDHNIVTEGND